MRYVFCEVGDGSIEECLSAHSISALLYAYWLHQVRDSDPGDFAPAEYEYLKERLGSRNQWPPGVYDLHAGCGGRGWYLLVVPEDGVAWKVPEWFTLPPAPNIPRENDFPCATACHY